MAEKRAITCIACPMGCALQVWRDDKGEVQVENYSCKRGIAYGAQEFENPMRTVTSSMLVTDGTRPLCAVKTRDVVPKVKIPEILEILRTSKANAPIAIGQVLVGDIAGTGVDVVATAAVGAKG